MLGEVISHFKASSEVVVLHGSLLPTSEPPQGTVVSY